ncbi:MAG: hypothetical protein AAF514_12410, partial [Verrucomicrobiota bacterium]
MNDLNFDGNMRFSCPSCQGILEVPITKAGVQGPCPRCAAEIIGPSPSHHLPARLVFWPGRQPVSGARLSCHACGKVLDLSPNKADVTGGPCPSCETWLHLPPLPGEQVQPLPEPVHTTTAPIVLFPDPMPSAPVQRVAEAPLVPPGNKQGLSETPFPVGRTSPPVAPVVTPVPTPSPVQLRPQRSPGVPIPLERTRSIPEPENLVRKKVIKRRARKATDAARKPIRLPAENASDWTWILTVAGCVVLATLGIAFAVGKLDLLSGEPPSLPSTEDGQLASAIDSYSGEISQQASASWQLAEKTLQDFMAAPTWKEAEAFLLYDAYDYTYLSKTLSDFPRDRYRNGQFRIIPHRGIGIKRVPKTEFHIFTFQNDNGGSPAEFFAILEQTGPEEHKIHARHLHQVWMESLETFFENPENTTGRFYLNVAQMPDASVSYEGVGYRRIRIQDYFGKAENQLEALVQDGS